MQNTFEKKYILPFFWQHGEPHEALLEEMRAIRDAGIEEFCVESRTHEKFCEREWWEDFGYILKTAEEMGMRVWLLDDKRFPSGYANNYIETHRELRKISLCCEYRDFSGPRKNVSLIAPRLKKDESFVSIVAYRRERMGNFLAGTGIDLLPNLHDGLLYCNIPEGIYRVYFIIRTRRYVEGKENYIDMLSKESCRAMLTAVYEPHFEHFRRYFGSTFRGFFSDEPGFSNEVGNYNSVLGKEGMLIPWNDRLPSLIAQAAGRTEHEILLALPAFWHDIEGLTRLTRGLYMDMVTKLYRENFSFLLGDWCRAHSVLYIGHVIEDMNTHQRLGYGAGHYFRALDGQDMAGIDVVLQQQVPGMMEIDHTAPVAGQTVDPCFFRYALAKLGASHAHIQPLKMGRAMCEIYGAFGWAEGLPMMKQMTDHMLVNGINCFVPHAFTPRENDEDCPPHFYAKGTNPNYSLFYKLMEYTQRCCHLLSGGTHVAQAAVLYNAEAEWAGGKFRFFQDIAKTLTQNQIDFDIVPEDVFYDSTAEDRKLRINCETYGAVIVPYSETLPHRLLVCFKALADAGVPVIYTDAFPSASIELHPVEGLFGAAKVTSLPDLPAFLRVHGIAGLDTDQRFPYLRYYQLARDGGFIYMFTSEDIYHETDVWVTPREYEPVYLYDAWENKIYCPQTCQGAFRLHLGPGGSIFAFTQTETPEGAESYPYSELFTVETLSQKFRISVRNAGKDSTWQLLVEDSAPFDLTAPDNDSRFCGSIRYETALEAKRADEILYIDLGTVGESAELWVNGVYCGARIAPPYRFNLKGRLKNDENSIIIETVNNPGFEKRDEFSTYLPMPPSGIQGPVTLLRAN